MNGDGLPGSPEGGRYRSFAIAIVAGVLALSVVQMFPEKLSRKMPDLEVYWTAASRARSAAPLYRSEDGHYQFKYLPAFAVLTAPAGRAPRGGGETAGVVGAVVGAHGGRFRSSARSGEQYVAILT